MTDNAITVSQLNLYVKSLLDSTPRLAFVNVRGELSNFKNHYSSGHWYFTLKDKDASIRCVMFRSAASRVRFSPEDGISVIIGGRVSIYEKDGQYQLYAEEMHADGEGDLALAFRQVKEKLEKEGLFNPETKRPLPSYPKKIAVITSDTGAAIQDICNITARRYPLCTLVICPVAVQGESAVPDMLDALERVYELPDIDVIIIGRGGGSAEDLAAFNDEKLARKIYESPVPVISAVGHETDFSISDFVADLRAPTPSAAAELAVPDVTDLSNRIDKLKSSLSYSLKSRYELSCTRLDNTVARLNSAIKRRYDDSERRYKNLLTLLDSLSPLKVMSRGYAAVENENGTLTTVKQLKENDEINVVFTDGSAKCRVENIEVSSNESEIY